MATKPNFGGKLEPELRRLPSAGVTLRVGSTERQHPTPNQYWAKRVQNFPLFAGISPQDRSTILGVARERQFARGETISIEGDQLRQVILLTYGSAKMVQCGQDGSAVILRLCGPGELVGTLGVSMQERYRCTSQALTACSALVWESCLFESLSTRFAAMRLNVAYILYKQLEDMENRFREISTERVPVRLGRQILRLVEQVGIRSNGSVDINMTREELAQLIGTSLFTVSRLLSDWDRKGIVVTRREGFSVVNVEALTQLIA